MDERFRRLGLALRRMERLKTTDGDRSLAPLGLSVSLWGVLRQIAISSAPSANAMAEAVFMTPQAFGELIKKLLKLGMIRKKSNVGRAIQYELTDEGKEAFAQADAMVDDLHNRLFSPLNDEEIDRFNDFLERIIRNMQE